MFLRIVSIVFPIFIIVIIGNASALFFIPLALALRL